MRFFTFLLIFCFIYFIPLKGNAQVTIGSQIAPLQGSLLDLKEYEADAMNATSNKGLLLPRVELKDAHELIFSDIVINDSDGDGDQKKKHVGLMVYNIADNDDFCPGLYIWNGTEWISFKNCSYPITIDNVGPYYIASGQDFQTIRTIPLNATWSTNTPLAFENSASNPLFGKVEFQTVNLASLTSPANITLTPKAMSAMEVDETSGNPFRTKESKIKFTTTDNNNNVLESKEITVNQTNKTIMLDNSYTPVQIIYTKPPNSIDNFQTTVNSNAKWIIKKRIPDDATNVITNIKVEDTPIMSLDPSTAKATFSESGSERYDNQANNTILTYTVDNNPNTVALSKIILGDANPTPRFNDIEISVYQCNNAMNSQQQTMVEWTELLGFTGVLDKETWLSLSADDRASADAKARIDIPMPISGVAWHRDQNGNIFLSGSFVANDPLSNDNRWMITNLAATTYDPIRDDGTTAAAAPVFNIKNDDGTKAYIAYPRPSSSSYQNPNPNDPKWFNYNPRLGMLYSWAAATMSRTSSAANNVQGICPHGWHLPSVAEFTQLLGNRDTNPITYGEIPNHFSTYSTLPDGSNIDRTGTAVKEGCQEFNSAGQGQSNPIKKDVRAGFNWMLVGYAYTGSYGTVEKLGGLWTSNFQAVWVYVWDTNTYVLYNNTVRKYNRTSVRCKKNTP